LNTQPKHYWNDETRNLIRLYIDTTGHTERNNLFNMLYLPLLTTINHALHKYQITDDDYIQDCTIFLYVKVLPRLDISRVITAHQYIFNSICNHIKNRIKKDTRIRNKQYIFFEDFDDRPTTDDMRPSTISYLLDIQEEDMTYIIDTKINIIRRLDEMVRRERVINKPNSIFLLGLKEYLLSNDFDPREFNKFIQKQMNINYNTYNIIASRLGIRTKLLNEKFIKDLYLKPMGKSTGKGNGLSN